MRVSAVLAQMLVQEPIGQPDLLGVVVVLDGDDVPLCQRLNDPVGLDPRARSCDIMMVVFIGYSNHAEPN